MKLSKNFSLQELIASATATKYKINNTPNNNVVNNLKDLANYCLQPIRDNYNKPVIISSGFRCMELNAKVGGARNSQHLIGQAADFKVSGIEIDDVIEWCVNNLEYDQLIDEYAKGKHWIHISFNKGCNRKQTLIYKRGVYSKWTKKD